MRNPICLFRTIWRSIRCMGFVSGCDFKTAEDPTPENVHVLVCKICGAQRLRFRDMESLMLFTHDEETALQLKSAFLPGQLGAVQDLQQNAFAYGFLTALDKLGEGNGD